MLHVCLQLASAVHSTSLPYDAVHSADYAVARYLSVHPSVTRWYSVETAKRILELLSPSGSDTIRIVSCRIV